MMIEIISSEAKDPVLVTRGLSEEANLKIAQSIDWLAVTISREDLDNAEDELGLLTGGVEMKKGMNGYDVGTKYSSGLIELSSTTRRDMGVHFIMTGDVCQRQKSMALVVDWFVRIGGVVRRIDFATDIFDSGLSFDRMIHEIKCGNYVCDIRKKPEFFGAIGGGGATIYFGRKSASVYTKIYDKAAERNVSGDWKRVETTYRDDKGHPAALQFLAGKSCREMTNGHIKFTEYKEWQEAMGNSAVQIEGKKKEVSATLEWLLKQVAPAMAREKFFNDMAWVMFQDAVQVEFEKIVQSSQLRRHEGRTDYFRQNCQR